MRHKATSATLPPCLFIMITYLSVDSHFSPRSVSGLDKEPDLVHMEAHTPDGSECPEHVFSLESRNKQGLLRRKSCIPRDSALVRRANKPSA